MRSVVVRLNEKPPSMAGVSSFALRPFESVKNAEMVDHAVIDRKRRRKLPRSQTRGREAVIRADEWSPATCAGRGFDREFGVF